MRKAILIVLTMLLLIFPAYAAEGEAATDQPIQQEQEPVVVATLEELQAAIDAAEDGDTITLAANDIHIPNGVTLGSSDKYVTLQLSTEFANVFEFGSVLVLDAGENETIIQNITFNGNEILSCSIIHAWCNMSIDNCSFINCNAINDSSVITIYQTKAIITNSSFYNVHAVNAGIAYVGTEEYLEISNCEFEEINGNICDLVQNFGTTVLNANYYKNNTSSESGHMIQNKGTLYIDVDSDNYTQYYGYAPKGWYIDALLDDSGFILFETWEPLETSCTNQHICLTFNSDNMTPEFKPVQPPEGEETDNPDIGDQNTPQQPEQPPQDGSEGDPTQTPEQPTEPPQGDTTDKPTDTTPDTPQPPKKPSDGNNSGDDGNTPPTDYRPSQRPTSPSVTVKPIESSKPQDQPENNSAPAKPQLVCNGAVIDTSRTVVLLGYGDGIIHENDPLTRAQLATIIYRLLDDESIAKYNNAQVTFADVAADDWYAPYVKVIQAAGIVNGVGDGKYDPNGKVTWTQIITILTRFVQPQEYTLQHIQYKGWATKAIQTAVANGWIEDSAEFNPDAIISRGQLEQLINGVLTLYR